MHARQTFVFKKQSARLRGCLLTPLLLLQTVCRSFSSEFSVMMLNRLKEVHTLATRLLLQCVVDLVVMVTMSSLLCCLLARLPP